MIARLLSTKTVWSWLLPLLLFFSAASGALERTPVGSGGIASAGYDEASKMMEVEFKNGRVVQYQSVLFSTYDKLLMAEDKAQFFKENIKGKYQGKVVSRGGGGKNKKRGAKSRKNKKGEKGKKRGKKRGKKKGKKSKRGSAQTEKDGE